MFAAPTVQLNGTSTCIAAGVRGVRQTLSVMRRLVREYRVNLGLLTAARNLIFLTPAKDDNAEVEAIFNFVRDSIRYTRDIYEVETISSPDKTLETRVGDCDDKTTLLATLLECVGYPTRFVVTGYTNPGELEHVYLQVFGSGQWIDADSTEPYPLGWAPPDPVTLFHEEI